MRKRLLALVIASVMIIGTGCSSGKADTPAAVPARTEAKTESKAETGAPKETEGPMEPVTIGVANYVLLEQSYETFWNGIKTGSKVENPNIAIEWVTAPYGETVNQVINITGDGDRIGMIFGRIGWISGLADTRFTVPAADILPADYLTDFHSTILDSFSIDGQPYGLPMYISPYVLYYSTELFEQTGPDPATPPITYDEVLEYAEEPSKLKDSDGNPVYAFSQATTSIPVSGSSTSGMVFSFGGTLLVGDGALSVDNQGFRDTITMLKTLNGKGYNPQNAKLKDLRNLFALEQLAMYYGQPWGFSGVQSISPDARNFTTSARSLSGRVGKGQSILQAHCPMYADSGGTQREVCSKLTRYLVTSEVLNDYLANIAPAYPAKKDTEGNKNMSSVLTGAAGSTESVTAQVFVPQINDLNLELYTLTQPVTTSSKNADTTVTDFKKAVEAILEQ